MLRTRWKLSHLFLPTTCRDSDLWEWFPDRWRLLNQRWGCTLGRQETGTIQRQKGTNCMVSSWKRAWDWARYENILFKQKDIKFSCRFFWNGDVSPRMNGQASNKHELPRTRKTPVAADPSWWPTQSSAELGCICPLLWVATSRHMDKIWYLWLVNDRA